MQKTTVSQPAVSVIMPVYNGGRHLEEAVRSVLAQSFSGWELIIVDDGSTDGSPDLISRLAAEDTRIRAVRQENAGQSAARNAGAALARGRHLAFLDQDDRYHPEHLERLCACLDADPQAGIAYADVDVMDGAGHILSRQALSQGLFPFSKRPHPKRTALDCLKEDMCMLPGACLVRAQAFHEAGGFDPELCGYEDDDLFLRIFWHWRFTFVPEPGLVYRFHAGSASRSPRFSRSRMHYYRKLKAWYPDIPELRMFWHRDLMVLRFCLSILGAGELARREGDKHLVRLLYDNYREISPKPLVWRMLQPLMHPLMPDRVYFFVGGLRRFLRNCVTVLLAK